MEIAIIKLGALGDVVRTTPILGAIKEKYPNSKITWITKKESLGILECTPGVDYIKLTPYSEFYKKFDILYNFDIDDDSISLINKINASKKYGFYSLDGFPVAFNSAGEYYLNTVFDDQAKKSNKKSYQQMIFEIAELEWKKQKPILIIPKKERNWARDIIKKNNLKNKKIIGVNIGSSKRWPSKAWDIKKFRELIFKLNNKNYKIILLGGDEETKSKEEITSSFNNSNIKIFSPYTGDSLKKFFALINLCDLIVCGDTLALHVATALNKKIISLFFCTSPSEIEDYGIIKKIISPELYKFFPENSDQYNESLVNSISVEDVFDSLNKTISKS